MQKDTSSTGHQSFNFNNLGDYDLATSYRSILAGYLANDSISDEMLERLSYPQVQVDPQQQLLHQELMNRHSRLLNQLHETVQQTKALRQDNVNLKMTNLDLNNRLNLLLNAPPLGVPGFDPGLGLGTNLDSMVEELQRMSVKEHALENELARAENESPTSVMDSGQAEGSGAGGDRVSLPKSISVRSSGYLKTIRAGGSGGGGRLRPQNQGKIPNPNETQKVVLKGGKKEGKALELEVYNQGMFKTELCNKWQQTGTCPYGDHCQFAHGIQELRPVLRHPRYKTEVCRMVLNGDPCPYGHRCHFRHTLTDEEKLMRSLNSRTLKPLNYR